ncbi:hypothetical protein NA57DRAFT_72278 [Rhizodiscina lignyota]|uniref:Ecp2 effector protein domain-containing protein n=1 Tax=Rhizodiscina lignyota TaxID=1504668 RepID=A0A9P4MDB4_9PEZI|nr:hypothetical protein NA57DRAFT_72278 [Rhizodiscina lignyota]
MHYIFSFIAAIAAFQCISAAPLDLDVATSIVKNSTLLEERGDVVGSLTYYCQGEKWKNCIPDWIPFEHCRVVHARGYFENLGSFRPDQPSVCMLFTNAHCWWQPGNGKNKILYWPGSGNLDALGMRGTQSIVCGAKGSQFDKDLKAKPNQLQPGHWYSHHPSSVRPLAPWGNVKQPSRS